MLFSLFRENSAADILRHYCGDLKSCWLTLSGPSTSINGPLVLIWARLGVCVTGKICSSWTALCILAPFQDCEWNLPWELCWLTAEYVLAIQTHWMSTGLHFGWLLTHKVRYKIHSFILTLKIIRTSSIKENTNLESLQSAAWRVRMLQTYTRYHRAPHADTLEHLSHVPLHRF